MNIYFEIVKEYKKEFSTKKYAKKYFSLKWILYMSTLAILVTSTGVWNALNESMFVFSLYILLMSFTLWQFLRKLNKIDGEVIKLINKSKLERLLFKYKLLLEKDPLLSRHRLIHLTTILNRELARKKLSVRIFSPFAFILTIALKYFISQSKLIAPYLTADLVLLLGLILIGFVTLVVPTFQIILDRGYNKEVEFRNRIDELLLTSSLSFEQSSECISFSGHKNDIPEKRLQSNSHISYMT
ncbi:hypothetical protein [Paenibacillus chitinolyticus]|uniref:hypothetical protein n=1 Tax=Paenibacillus chitinolyticus TaxID=79263 RepID=UPI00366E823C